LERNEHDEPVGNRGGRNQNTNRDSTSKQLASATPKRKEKGDNEIRKLFRKGGKEKKTGS